MDTTTETVPVLTEESWLWLHELRLRRFAPAAGTPAEEALVTAGFVIARGGKAAITPPGIEADAAWARLAPGSPEEKAAQAAYERFLVLNREFLQICTDWQLNDSAARTDDVGVAEKWMALERLDRLDERAGAFLARLSAEVGRFHPYRDRLAAALGKVADDPDWLASPRCDSYHTVWMRLHEDLLAAVGANRANEPPLQ